MRPIYRHFASLLLALLALSACSPSADKPSSSQSASSQQSSAEYVTLAAPQPAEAGNKVEVIEFFAYFCSHCKAFDPSLSDWAKKNADRVVFKRVPVAFRENMMPQQRMYFALEAMGKLDAVHEKAFVAVQDERLSLSAESEILEFVGRLGVDKEKFKDLYDSFGIQSKAKNAIQQQTDYKIDSVPTIAIDGRFITSASHAGNRPGVQKTEAGLHAATLQVMDELVGKIIKERKSAPSAK